MRDIRKQKSAHRKSRGRYKLYIAELLGLTAIVMAAFFIPQLLFRIQDGILYGRTELSQRESMDLEALSNTYEASLHQRMLNFAEGLAMGDSFYVNARNLTPNKELEDYLNSDSMFLLTEEMMSVVLLPMIFWDYGYEVSQWTQYVIYSDNYAKGVNFILWYIELDFSGVVKLSLLKDAQTDTIYALKVQGCDWMDSSPYSVMKYSGLLEQESLIELWLFCALRFEVISSETDLLEQFTRSGGSQTGAEGRTGTEIELTEKERYVAKEMAEHYIEIVDDSESADIRVGFYEDELTADDYRAILDYIEERIESDPENRLASLRLPYGNASLEAVVKIGELQTQDPEFSYMYPDITFGIRQIYEMIPEFR